MKITIVQGGTLPIPPIRGGAIEKVWFSLGREFAKRGHEVTHVSRTFSQLPDEQWLDGVHHVRVRGFEFSSKRRVVVWRDLWYALRVLRVLPKADILVTNNPVLPLLIRTRRFGALYVHVARYPKGQMRFYRHASRIQTISRAVADAIRKEIPADGGKVCHIPYPIMRGDFTGGDSASEKTEKLVLYVGRIHPEKGLDYLVEAFGLLKGGTGWRLAIVGPWEEASGGGGEAYRRRLEERSVALGPPVEWVGPVFNEDELEAWYRRAALFVYPSLADQGEALGLAPLEAMAFGCPILVSRLACFRDFLAEGTNGLSFDHRAPEPVAELAKTLESALRSWDWLSQAGQAARQTASDFALPVIASTYLKDFERVVSLGA